MREPQKAEIQRKSFDFKYIVIALIFLIDFNIENLDILPDFMAVFFISKAIGKAWFINESLAEARTLLKVFYAVSLAKFALGIVYRLFLRGPNIEYNSLSMMFTFIFALFELILLILIFKKIFISFEQFSFMSGSFDSTLNARTVANVMNIFFIVRSAATFAAAAPWLLSDHDLDALSMRSNIFTHFTHADIVNMVTPPSFIIQTLMGIFMLSVAAPFFARLSKDSVLCEAVEAKITRRQREDFFFGLKLNLKSAFAFFTAGCVFFVDLWFEQVNFLPDFIICVLFFLGVTQIAGNDREMINKKLNVYLLLNIPVSITAYILQSIYSVRLFYAFAAELPALNNLKIAADLFYHASVILFFLTFIEFYYFIKKLQYKHTEFAAGYLNKYFTADEKVLYKNRNKVLIFGAVIFCIKTLAVLLPRDDGLVPFLYSLALIIFAVWAVRALLLVKENIYSCYTGDD